MLLSTVCLFTVAYCVAGTTLEQTYVLRPNNTVSNLAASLKTSDVKSNIECAVQCSLARVCSSYNINSINESSQTCELLYEANVDKDPKPIADGFQNFMLLRPGTYFFSGKKVP